MPDTRTDVDLHAIARRAYAAMSSLPNVHAVGIGCRVRGGQASPGVPVLKVLVSRKLPPAALDANALVPPQFEGLETDVLQVPVGVECALTSPIGVELRGGNYENDAERSRPLQAGTQIMGATRRSKGTLGFLARVAGDSRIMAVTCSHTLFEHGQQTSSSEPRPESPSKAAPRSSSPSRSI